MRNLSKYGIDITVAEKYAENLEYHISCVQKAGQDLGLPMAQLRAHDSSKWSMIEFPEYANWFYGDKTNQAGIERAFLHHVHHNPHHWEYWWLPANWHVRSDPMSRDGMLEMPMNYLYEMVADWQGVSLAYTGSADMSGWLDKNLQRIGFSLHRKSQAQLYLLLSSLGYREAVNNAANAEFE